MMASNLTFLPGPWNHLTFRKYRALWLSTNLEMIHEFFPPRLYPTTPIRFGELDGYLKAYDLRKQGEKWREVAEVVYPKGDWNESLQRSLLMDLKKAKEVISNVEYGEFPGKY